MDNGTLDVRVNKLETDMQVVAERISVLHVNHADLKDWLMRINDTLEAIKEESHKTAIALTKLTELEDIEKRLDSAEKKIERLSIWKWTLAGALGLLVFLIKLRFQLH